MLLTAESNKKVDGCDITPIEFLRYKLESKYDGFRSLSFNCLFSDIK